MPNPDRPNILVIMSDQHNRHVAGCYGDELVRTPNIDRLAAEGVALDSAYCNYPLCCPARSSFMAGRHPFEIEAWANPYVLPSHLPTFAHALGRAGYRTVLCGRMHFNGPDQRHGFAERIFPECGGGPTGMLGNTNRFHRDSISKSGPGRNDYLLYDQHVTDAAVEWLGGAGASGDGPFCLVVGLVGPHCPFVCPPELFERYFDAVTVPKPAELELATRHPYARRAGASSDIDDLSEHEIRRTRAAYYGMIDFDDRQVGRILDALDAAGLTQRTAVVYTSDHGDMAGEHGLWWKMSFYEGSAGVPMVMSWPGRLPAGRRVSAPVTLADLAATLVEVGGCDPIPGASARGFADLLTGGDDDGREAFSELIGDMFLPPNGPSGGPARMLRRGPWKCNYYHGDRPELFHLGEDPAETNDRAADPACRDVLEAMTARILDGWDPERIAARAAELLALRDYTRSAPADPSVLAGEYWQAPADYGYVEPV